MARKACAASSSSIKKVLLSNNIGKAIKESFGYDIDEFNRRFNRYLRKKYFPVLLEKKSPDDYGDRDRRFPEEATTSPSPRRSLRPASSSRRSPCRGMDIDLVIIAAEDGKRVRNLTKGWTNDYRELVTAVFEGKRDLSWSPTADEVADLRPPGEQLAVARLRRAERQEDP